MDNNKVKFIKKNKGISWAFVLFMIILSSSVQLYCSYIYFNITNNTTLFKGFFLYFCVQIILFLALGLRKRFQKSLKLYIYVGVLGLCYSIGFSFLAAVFLGAGIVLKIVIFSTLLIASIVCCVLLENLARKKFTKEQKNKAKSKECVEYISPQNKKVEIISFLIIVIFICLSKFLGIFVFMKFFLPVLGLCYSLFYSFLIAYKKNNQVVEQSGDRRFCD